MRHQVNGYACKQRRHKEANFLRNRQSPSTTTTGGRALGTDDGVGRTDAVLIAVLLVVDVGAVMVLDPVVDQGLQDSQRNRSVLQDHGVKVPNVEVLACTVNQL